RSGDPSLRHAPEAPARRPARARGARDVHDRARGVVRVPARVVPRARRLPRPARLPRGGRPARFDHRSVPRQRRVRDPGTLQLLMRDVVPIYLSLPPREIAYVKFVFESYEGVAVVRTLDRRAATL